jgi:transcription elongation factor GreA
MALISNEKRIELENRLNQLVNVDRPSNIKAIQEAREQGDLSENADYDAAKTKQGEIESEIALIQDQLNNAEILNGTVTGTENLATDIIHVGSKVNGNFNGVEDT